LTAWLAGSPPARVVFEVGTHSPWVSRLVEELGHTAVVANARKVQAVTAATQKSDQVDAETLTRLERVDPLLLAPHRGLEAQVDLAQLRARDAVGAGPDLLINHVRGALKSLGYRAPAAITSHSFAVKVAPGHGLSHGALSARPVQGRVRRYAVRSSASQCKQLSPQLQLRCWMRNTRDVLMRRPQTVL
jgi:hypothetical protein